MPRILQEEEEEEEEQEQIDEPSSDESYYEISEDAYSSAKYPRNSKESSSTSLHIEPSSNLIEGVSSRPKTAVSNGTASTNRKRAREESEDLTFNAHDTKRARHVEDCQWCQLEAFRGFKEFPVIISNEVDDIALPTTFRFIQKSIYREGVEPAADAFRTGCECKNASACEVVGCSCTEDVEKVPGTKVAAHRMQYQTPPGIRDCLKDAFLDQRQAIYECNDKCACGPSCRNRVVQRGRKIPLEIFKTHDNRGWGLRCQKNISKGQFIDLYVGEVITAEEAQRRRQESNVEKRKDVYLFALDKFTDRDSYDERLRGPPLEVDGEFMSGPTRFMNHSCEPNTRIFARVGDSANKHIHDLAFFAIKDIPAYTELTFDYVDGKDDELDEDDEGDRIECLCGSKKCRGWMW